MNTYTLLDVEDIVERGDEMYADDPFHDAVGCPQFEWRPIQPGDVGGPVVGDDYPIRRSMEKEV